MAQQHVRPGKSAKAVRKAAVEARLAGPHTPSQVFRGGYGPDWWEKRDSSCAPQ